MLLAQRVHHLVVRQQRALVVPVGIAPEIERLALRGERREEVAVGNIGARERLPQQIAVVNVRNPQSVVIRHMVGVERVFVRSDGEKEPRAVRLRVALNDAEIVYHAVDLTLGEGVPSEIIIGARGVIEPAVRARDDGVHA